MVSEEYSPEHLGTATVNALGECPWPLALLVEGQPLVVRFLGDTLRAYAPEERLLLVVRSARDREGNRLLMRGARVVYVTSAEEARRVTHLGGRAAALSLAHPKAPLPDSEHELYSLSKSAPKDLVERTRRLYGLR